MRMSTSEFFSLNVNSMSEQQSVLGQLYQQIATGVSLSTPSDNPLGAAQAVQLSMQGAALAQYSRNQDTVLASLQSEDTTLGEVSSVLQNINTLLVRAGDGSLNDGNRSAIATELQGLRNQLMTLANATDPQGNFLFAGFKTTAQPFSVDASGAVIYTGDTGSRDIQVSDTRQIASSDNGVTVFSGVAAVGTTSIPAGNPANTGNGAIGGVSTNNAGDPANAHAYLITFAGTAPAITYTVTDQSTGVVSAAQPYTSSAGITLGGQSVTISGTPAAGDSFTVTPATQAGTDVFANIDDIVSALQTPTGSAAAVANLTNALSSAMGKLKNTMNNVVTVQASVGGREQEVQALQTVTQASVLQTKSSLADLTTTNLTATISQYSLAQYALQAAQQGFMKIQGMSLFNYMGN
ncbi:flagellar hook-associated protein FlgL [Paraburkholderia hayleyella]|uniref:flagellar hook-associated protein FlgL n=1 Tax=Paraburkholderia hayleyella TaxID=2152889 RepID=UPI0012919A74|nr:flagellar hook-associated protein FlgL [Paraburkholderia hayleyella]